MLVEGRKDPNRTRKKEKHRENQEEEGEKEKWSQGAAEL